jgi:hypothetical protein
LDRPSSKRALNTFCKALKVTIELRAELRKLKGLETLVPPSFEELNPPSLSNKDVLSIKTSSAEEIGNEEASNQLKSSKFALKALIVLRYDCGLMKDVPIFKE